MTPMFSLLDSPEVLMFLFHPRSGYGVPSSVPTARDVLIPVAPGVAIGARLYIVAPTAVNLLFFHGNGEIVDDYDDLGEVYNQIGINFLAVDYRGYGQSTGSPTSSALLQDSHAIFTFVTDWLQRNGCSGPLGIMGRSLGSAAALELASHYPGRIAGIVIESGFAYTGPLFRLIGIDVDKLGFTEAQGFHNLEKIKKFAGPTLIIHAERDHIIPFSDGQTLYAASPAADKTFLKIPHANHNNILAIGFKEYMQAIQTFSDKLRAL